MAPTAPTAFQNRPDTPDTLPSRSSSPELGTPSLKPQYNKKTGRPIRRSAGHIKSLAGFVDSAVLDEDDDEPMEVPSEDDDDGEAIWRRRSKKRKRSPSPAPPPLDPIIYDEAAEGPSDNESIGHDSDAYTPVTLQFNIPLGFHGPLVVKLDRSLLARNTGSVAHDVHKRKVRRNLKPATSNPVTQKPAIATKKTGFCDLPPELRNKIYWHVFVVDNGFRFPVPSSKTVSCSSQFLRTCRLVHSEGCSVLYGENTFGFDRNRSTRGTFWDPIPKEIGYKDIRQFLKMIGPENLAYLRDVKLVLEDANQSSTPYINSHEERRYLNDEHLIDCLRILRTAKLRKITVSFLGRRALTRADVKFVDYLERVKADEVLATEYARYFYTNKIHSNAWEYLKEHMTRKKKLYAKE
jgi:hypothetical protein